MDKEFFYNKSKYQDMDFFDLVVINEKEILKTDWLKMGFARRSRVIGVLQNTQKD